MTRWSRALMLALIAAAIVYKDLKPGDRVKHTTLGEGVVTGDGPRKDAFLQVRFDSGKSSGVSAEFLEKIG